MTAQDRYLMTGFYPVRHWWCPWWVEAEVMQPRAYAGWSPPWTFRSLTVRGLVRKMFARYAKAGYWSVSLSENRTYRHGGVVTVRRHKTGPEWRDARRAS